MNLCKEIKEIYEYREMIKMMVRRDLRGRYKASFLGFAWTFLNPLLQLFVYTMVFSVILRSNIEKYYIFLFVALIPWMAMSSSITTSSSCVTSQSNLVTKIYFPRRVLPITAVTTCFVNMLLCMIVVLIVCLFSVGIRISILWYLIPTILIEYILALGLGMIVSCLTVYIRDMEYMLTILVMAWQFLTPVMYSISVVPERLLTLFNLNPMTPVIVAFRSILYYKEAPQLGTMITALIMGLVFLIVGWIVFGKLEKGFAEEL